jgi:cytoplasmic iron level regulating protein YaaA (DUF328/UPF0246 family)
MSNEKPTLILPCSASKLATSAPAYHLYTGTGYLGIVKQFSEELLKKHFNIYFVSAKLGLIKAFDVIEPYEEPMTAKRLKQMKLNDFLGTQAKTLASEFSKTKDCYMMIPKAYKELLHHYIDDVININNVVESAGGIGSQRGQLKKIIESELT